MSEVVFDFVLLLVVAVIVLVAIYRYRAKFAMTFKAWGVDLGIKGENSEPAKQEMSEQRTASETQTSMGSHNAKGNIAEANGDGAVAIGGNANGATITTSSTKTDSKIK